MTKHIDVTLTDKEWDAIVTAVDAYSIDVQDRAEYNDEFGALARREAKALDRAWTKLRDGS